MAGLRPTRWISSRTRFNTACRIALASLKPEDREAIIARVEMGYSYEQLADALRKPSLEAAAIQQYTVEQRSGPATKLTFLAIGRSGRKDIADRHETMLWADPHKEPKPGRPRRRRRPRPQSR